MPDYTGKSFGFVPLFDPAKGMVVRRPPGDGPGFWAGAPSAAYDESANAFYLVYRVRKPREQGRGYECRIAAGDNGIDFTDIWTLAKSSIHAESIERASLVRLLDGRWALYVGYVAEEDGRWRIGMIEARRPEDFDYAAFRPILLPEALGCEGVKDPNVYLIGRMFYMLASYAPAAQSVSPEDRTRMHATGDVFNTGITLSRTGAAVSGDGRTFQWLGDASPVARPQGDAGKAAWDLFCRRTAAILPLDTGGYLAFYDGSASVSENYEERTGLAFTADLREYISLSPCGPNLASPHASGSLRYLDVLPVGFELFFYYELARADGGHELRVSVVERG